MRGSPCAPQAAQGPRGGPSLKRRRRPKRRADGPSALRLGQAAPPSRVPSSGCGARGGKSGLARAQRRVTPGLRTSPRGGVRGQIAPQRTYRPVGTATGRGERASVPRDRGTEHPERVRVKRRGKSPPRRRRRRRHGKPRCEQGQAMESCSLDPWVGCLNPSETSGLDGWRRPREGHRTRLTGLPFFLIIPFRLTLRQYSWYKEMRLSRLGANGIFLPSS